MSANIIKFISRKPPNWAATVFIEPVDGGIEATLVGFSGNDGYEVEERCRLFASALRELADKLDVTADAVAEPKL